MGVELTNDNKSNLSPKERRFLQLVFDGHTQDDAYRQVTKDGANLTDKTARANGSRLMSRIKKKRAGVTTWRMLGWTISVLLLSYIAYSDLRFRFFMLGKRLAKKTTDKSKRRPSSFSRNFYTSGKARLMLIFPVLLMLCVFTYRITAETKMQIKPQPGPQEEFLSTSADIAIYGGAAGGGKTYALLMEPLRHIHVGDFGATIFRRTSPQITTEGGLWDTAADLYPLAGAKPIHQPLRWVFPSKAKIEMHHLQYDKDVYNWQGAQVPLIEFDELTQFTKKQFFYLLSRNRSMCGVKPYMRAATNPDPDSWVKDLVRWYLDDDGEYADQSKSGLLRYMVRSGDDLVWFDTLAEAKDYAYEIDPAIEPLSFTFIPSSVYDNKILLEKDPGYIAKLKALPRVERLRLEKGNWKVRATAGTIFARTDFEIIDSAPQPDREIRFWDRAASEPSTDYPDPDWTVGVKMQRNGNTFIITDVRRVRKKAGEVKQLIKNTASQDGRACQVGMFQDPGQAGKFEVSDYYTTLAGYKLVTVKETTKKYLKWQPFASQAQAGNVKLLRGQWNDAFLAELENLSENEKEYGHDDQGDATSGAFEVLTSSRAPRVGVA